MAVWILLTCDIHTHVQDPDQVREDLVQTRAILGRLQLPCTFFFPAHSAQLLCDQVSLLQEEGHEIGCHGLTHEVSENYSRLPRATQATTLAQATEQLSALLGDPPTSFRAPAFKVSPDTIQVLDSLGYRADVSVTAQRLGLFGSDIYDVGPFFAPRRPYHPSVENPFRRGTAKLWEIPVSAWCLPFLSNTERLLGLGYMRLFFRMLYWEARQTGKPIVFMFHSEDLNAVRGVAEPWQLSWRDFLPTKTHGFQFRHALFERDWRCVQRDLISLFEAMASVPDVRFGTVKDYVPVLEAGADRRVRKDVQLVSSASVVASS